MRNAGTTWLRARAEVAGDTAARRIRGVGSKRNDTTVGTNSDTDSDADNNTINGTNSNTDTTTVTAGAVPRRRLACRGIRRCAASLYVMVCYVEM